MVPRRLVLFAVFVALTLAPGAALAGGLRIAVYNAALSRDAPGLLLRDIHRQNPQTEAAAAMIRALDADILLITGFDQDLRNLALSAFVARLREGKDGIDYPHVFSPPGNNGLASLIDLDGNGRRTGWGDGWGWGKFPGHSGMALVSRLPIDEDAARTFRLLPWEEFPGASLPEDAEGNPWPDAQARAAMRLSSRGHWDVPVILPDGSRLHLLAAYPTPPVFDGPEGRNLRRNHDEIDFWRQYLDGWAAPDDAGMRAAAPEAPVVVIGSLNADPADGDGLRVAVQRLLAHDRLQDPRPASAGGPAAAVRQGGVNDHHLGDPALDTADWRDEDGPGNLRVDYVLPDARLRVLAAGVVWPEPEEPLAEAAETASAHRPVWVDLDLPETNGGLDRVAAGR
ncbi:MAG TPA: endonuclease/exonuclease/phosphatase family protein [Paracoccaceae bacterium]|nr:endonuclease/exonuclease/phosphatase family protein [Paracoccaceae bacterium]